MKHFLLVCFLLCIQCALSRRITIDPNQMAKKRFNKCTITIIVETDNMYSSLPMPTTTSVEDCYINYVYMVSSVLSYDENDIARDQGVASYYIVRNNYQDYGYLPFFLSLLHTSTYTLIIRDGYFEHSYPETSWIEGALRLVRNSDDNDIVTCHIDDIKEWKSFHAVPRGCLFFHSLHLRAIITKTEFRRNRFDPFIYIPQAFSCKFASRVRLLSNVFYKQPQSKNSWFSFLFRKRVKYEPFSYRIATNATCEDHLHLHDINCHTIIEDKTVGVLLSQYKRTYIYDQLKALLSSSVPISEILVYQNGNHQDYQKVFSLYPFIHHIWSTNWNSPFFLRHLLPMLMPTHFHIVFDDDIIPGVDTVKVLLKTVHKYNAPSGVGGRIIDRSEYRKDFYKMVCVDCAFRTEVTTVDFVIQVYARTEFQSKVYWRYRPYTHRNGDDIHGSLSWYMECGIHAQRPPFLDSAVYMNLGTDNVASFRTVTHNVVRPQTYRSWILGGYHGIQDSTVRSEYPATTASWEQGHINSIMRYF